MTSQGGSNKKYELTPRHYIFTGALYSGLAVLMGAFGSHGLKSKISEKHMEIFSTALDYHIWHMLALILLGLLEHTGFLRGGKWIALLWAIGILFFSASLYAYVMTQFKPLVYFTPIGGMCLVLGWVLLAYKSLKH